MNIPRLWTAPVVLGILACSSGTGRLQAQAPPATAVKLSTTIKVNGGGKTARRREQEIYAIHARGKAADWLQQIVIGHDYLRKPLAASVKVLRDGEVHQKFKLSDFTDLPALGGTFITDARVLVLDVDPLEAGDTLMVSWESELDPFFGFPVHTFGDPRFPTVQSRLSVDIPAELNPKYSVFNGLGPPRESEKGGRVCWTWEVDDLDAVDDEPLAPPYTDIHPAVSIGVDHLGWGRSATWEELAASYWERAQERLTQVDGSELAGRRDSLDPWDAILDRVQNNVRYVAIALGDGGWIPHSSDEVLRRKYGDCKDMSTLILSLLRGEGMDGDLAIVLTRPPAGLNVDPLPTLAFFNHAVVNVSGADGSLWLDATHSYGTSRSPRPDIQGSPTMVVSGPNRGYHRIEWTPPEQNRRCRLLHAVQNDDGSWSLRGRLEYFGSSAVRARFALERDLDEVVASFVLGMSIPPRAAGAAPRDVSMKVIDAEHIRIEFSWDMANPLDWKDGTWVFNPVWDRDPYPTALLGDRRRKYDVYWPLLETIEDSLVVNFGVGSEVVAADSLWIGEAPGLRGELMRAPTPGGIVLVRKLTVVEPRFRIADWDSGRAFREEVRRWSSTSIPFRKQSGAGDGEE